MTKKYTNHGKKKLKEFHLNGPNMILCTLET